ncbi:MAG: hypothetical protein WDN45_10510 [Caulobacteraceae bacterium]
MTNWRERRQGPRRRALKASDKDAPPTAIVVKAPAPIIFCLRSSAHARAEEALEALVTLVREAGSEHVKVSAANAILDRAFGKPLTGAQAAEEYDAEDEDDEEDDPVEVLWLGADRS